MTSQSRRQRLDLIVLKMSHVATQVVFNQIYHYHILRALFEVSVVTAVIFVILELSLSHMISRVLRENANPIWVLFVYFKMLHK